MVAKHDRLQGKDIAGVSEEVLARLMEYDYPGNVRELENIVEQAFVLCRGGLIELHHLPPELRPKERPVSFARPRDLAGMERSMIMETLARRKGNRKLTAGDLGLDTSTLYRKIKKFGLETPPSDGRGCRR